MGALSNHVNLVITADSVSVARAGFGIPLVLSATASFPERVRRYSSQAEVLVDFPTTNDPTALATAAMFGQSPHPSEVMVGRSALKPTQVYVITVLAVTNARAYAVNVKGKGVTTTSVSITSDADATNDEIVAALVTAINAISPNVYTAAATGGAGSQVVTITADNPGDWFSLEVVDPTALSIRQTHVDPGVATDLAAILLENDEWYWLYTLYNSEPYATAAAAWAQSNRKFYVVQSEDTRDLGTSTGTAGLADYMKAAGRTYVSADYHPAPNQMAGAALIGNIAPRTPGTWTAKFKRRAGISATTLTPTQRANLVARYCNFYETVAGVSITAEGTTSAGPSSIRGFIDNVVSLDWLENDMASGIFGALASADKILRTDEGMTVIESEMRGSLRRAIAQDVIVELSADENEGVATPSVSIPLISTMTDLLPRGVRATFGCKLAGAVHDADINGVVVL